MTRRTAPLPRRHLVLDATAAGALAATAPVDARRAAVLLAIAAADAGTTVPTSVRVEVAWDRRAPRWAGANRLVPDDDVLDRTSADLAAGTHAAGRIAVADRHVAVAAHRRAQRPDVTVVEVLTGDVADVRAVLDHLPPATARTRSPIDVRRV